MAKNMSPEQTAPTRYVTVIDAMTSMSLGTDLAQIWYRMLDATISTMGQISDIASPPQIKDSQTASA